MQTEQTLTKLKILKAVKSTNGLNVCDEEGNIFWLNVAGKVGEYWNNKPKHFQAGQFVEADVRESVDGKKFANFVKKVKDGDAPMADPEDVGPAEESAYEPIPKRVSSGNTPLIMPIGSQPVDDMLKQTLIVRQSAGKDAVALMDIAARTGVNIVELFEKYQELKRKIEQDTLRSNPT